MKRNYVILSDVEKFLINENLILKDALPKFDKLGFGFCICADNKKNITGVITDGDFRRFILKNFHIDVPLKKVMNKNFFHLNSYNYENEIINLFEKNSYLFIPIIKNNKLTEILIPGYINSLQKSKKNSEIEVVIMAGGKGTRMKPITNVIPKALIPISNKTIIEIIMDNFSKHGFNNFNLILAHKAKFIKDYLTNINTKYNIKTIIEKSPLGTAGGIGEFLKFEKNTKNFFVVNCDMIIDINFQDLYNYHILNNSDVTIVSSILENDIPYGVLNINDNGLLEYIDEKPVHNYLINTGLYIFSDRILKFLKNNQKIDMNELISIILKKNGKVSLYPVSRNSWRDYGNFKEYLLSLGDV